MVMLFALSFSLDKVECGNKNANKNNDQPKRRAESGFDLCIFA
jgi:hypothetical protein